MLLTYVLQIQHDTSLSIIPTNPPRPHIITSPHKRVIVLKHGERMILKIKEIINPAILTWLGLTNQTSLLETLASASATYRLGGQERCHEVTLLS